MENKHKIRFYYNGIKVNDGKLIRCFFSRLNEDCITIYNKHYFPRFPQEIHEVFDVKNESDSRTDYFETDYIRVYTDNPYYPAVQKALAALDAHNQRQIDRQLTRALFYELSHKNSA